VLGEWAAVLAPEAGGTAVVTHDALGMMPLFTALRDGELRVATHLSDLAPAGEAAQLDPVYLGEWLTTGGYSGHRTPFRSVRRLLPGESGEWTAGRLRILRTWKPERRDRPPSRDDEDELRARLAQVVRGAADDEGRTWVELSGGLDSSTVAATAVRAGIDDVAALSIFHSEWPEADERPWMRAVTDALRIPWHAIDGGEVLPFARPPGEAFAEPTIGSIDGAKLAACDELLAAHGVTRVLTGHGGDELFGANVGWPHHVADALVERRFAAALTQLRSSRRAGWEHRSWRLLAVTAIARPLLRHLLGRSQSPDAELLPGWMSSEFVRSHDLRRRARRRGGHRAATPGRQLLWDGLWAIALNGSAMRQRDVAHDVRHPLADLRLVEWLAALPWERILSPGEDRSLQRRAMAGLLPDRVRRRRSKGRATPAIVAGLSRSPTWFALLTDDPRIARAGLVDRERWIEAVRRARVGYLEADRFFLAAASLEAWMQQLEPARAAALRSTDAGSRASRSGGRGSPGASR
jgi:asparagine synthase (glutamine-hydrolysing)